MAVEISQVLFCYGFGLPLAHLFSVVCYALVSIGETIRADFTLSKKSA